MDDPAQATLQTCMVELANAAPAQAGAKGVPCFTTGRVSRRVHGVRTTKLRVRITYPSQTREDVIVCRVDTEGNVTIRTEEEANAAGQ